MLLQPDLPVMIMAWDPSLIALARSAALGPVLLKPFSPQELRDALTGVMFTRLKTTLSRAISDLSVQNALAGAQIEDVKSAERETGEPRERRRPPESDGARMNAL